VLARNASGAFFRASQQNAIEWRARGRDRAKWRRRHRATTLVIPAKAAIHFAPAPDQYGFRLSPE
jgi:hypothetical protein